jgi:hypothetical protein
MSDIERLLESSESVEKRAGATIPWPMRAARGEVDLHAPPCPWPLVSAEAQCVRGALDCP